MGIRNRGKETYDYCDQCGLKISVGEYVLMNWACGGIDKKELRKDYCLQYHTKLLEGQKEGKYDYQWSFK